MASWLDIAVAASTNASKSQPPVQWIWVAVLAVAALVAGFLLQREIDQTAALKAEVELAKKRAEDARAKALIEQNEAEVKRLISVAAELEVAAHANDALIEKYLSEQAAKKQQLDALRK